MIAPNTVNQLAIGDRIARSPLVGLLARSTVVAFELERLDQCGIATLTPFDHRYPQRFLARLVFKASGDAPSRRSTGNP